MAELTVYEYSPEIKEVDANLVEAGATGDVVGNPDGLIFFFIRNDSVGTTDVTIDTQKTLSGGDVDTDLPAVTVAAGKTYLGAAYQTQIFNDEYQKVKITCVPNTDIKVMAFRAKKL